MAFPAKVGQRSCPVNGFPGQAATRMAMRVHFMHRHVLDTVVILEEVDIPHTRCPRCDMMVPWRTLNRRHPATAQCSRGADRKRQRGLICVTIHSHILVCNIIIILNMILSVFLFSFHESFFVFSLINDTIFAVLFC